MLCLLTYFKRVCDKFEKGTLGIARKHVPTELTFERVVLTDKFDWKEQTKTSLCSILGKIGKHKTQHTQQTTQTQTQSNPKNQWKNQHNLFT